MIKVQSPLRISFMGGRTDFPSFYKETEGAVVLCTIDQYIYLEVKTSNNNKFEFYTQESEGSFDRREDITHKIIRTCLEFKNIQEPLHFKIFSDIPWGTGLGSSSALIVALLKALSVLKNESPSLLELAEQASYVEIQLLGCFTGKQDQYASVLGGLQFLRFCKDDSVVHEKILLSQERQERLRKSMCLFFTGKRRDGGQVLEKEKQEVGQNHASLLQMRDLALDFYKEISGSMNIENLGKILDQGWRIKRSLNSQISNPEIDEYYEKAMLLGAYGGKLIGAGGGGFLLFLCPPAKQKALVQDLKKLVHFPFSFSQEGVKVLAQ